MWSRWVSMRARSAQVGGVRIGGVELRDGALAIGWRLRPGDRPETLADVRLRAGNGWSLVEVLPAPDDEDEVPGGRFRVPLPDADPPWTLEGYGPAGPWSQQVALDPTVLADYRQGLPLAPSPSADAAGVRLAIDRITPRSDRLVVFYNLDLASPGLRLHGAATPTLRVGRTLWQAIPAPMAPDAATFGRAARDGVAYFPPQLDVGTRADFELTEVVVQEALALDVRVPVPGSLPGVVEPDIELPTGHRLEEVVVTRRGVVVRVKGGADLRTWVTFPVLHMDDGRARPSTGTTAAPSATVALFGPLPPATRTLFLDRVRIHAEVPGPWRVRFPVPMPF